jgi:hypothetical protein
MIMTDESHITIILDEITTRMCLKYRLKPVPFMMKALDDELHARAEMEMLTRFACPHQSTCKYKLGDQNKSA